MGVLFKQALARYQIPPAPAHGFKLYKSDDEKQYIFGWANVANNEDGSQIEDWQKDIVTPEELEKAAYNYVLNFRDTGEKHDPNLRKKGKLIESCVFTKEKMDAIGIPQGYIPEGWWVGFHIDDADAWEKIKSGDYQDFSVEGKGERVPIDNEPVQKSKIAKSYSECIEKFNPYHDRAGRFASSGGAASFTWRPNTAAGAKAIEREKQKSGGAAGSGSGEKSPEKVPEKAAGRGHIEPKDYFKGARTDKEAAEIVRTDLEKSSGQKITAKEADTMYEAVNQYSGGAYKQIRAAQSDPAHATAANKKAAASVEKLIELSPKWNGGEVYRGMNLEGENAAKMLKSLSPGAKVDMQGMSSWTSKHENAMDYTRGDGSKFIFVLPKTSHGTSISHFSNFPGEDEVLLSGKSQLKVKSVESKTVTSTGRMKKKSSVTYVTLEESA